MIDCNGGERKAGLKDVLLLMRLDHGFVANLVDLVAVEIPSTYSIFQIFQFKQIFYRTIWSITYGSRREYEEYLFKLEYLENWINQKIN